MKRILIWSGEHPWPVLAGLVLVSLLALAQLPALHIHISPQALSVDGDPARAFYEKTIATFGSDDITLVFVSDPHLFRHDRLERLKGVVANLERLPFVERTQSLFSLPYLRVKDDFVITRPFLADLPQTEAEAQALIQAALANPFVRHNLLSDDGTAMAIDVFLRKDRDRPPGFEAEVTRGIERALAPLRGRFAQAFQIGRPYVLDRIREQIEHDQRRILPLAAAVLLLTLVVVLGRFNGTLIPILTAALSVLWTLALMARLGIPLNVMTAMVPVLLIIIGSTEDIHLIAEFYAGLQGGRQPRAALRHMAKHMGLAVALTFLTSFLGFLSVAISPIRLVAEFGLVAALGLALNFFITTLLLPAWLRLMVRTQAPGRTGSGLLGNDRLLASSTRFILGHRRAVILVALGLTGLSLYFAAAIRVSNDVLDYFPERSEVRQRIHQVDHQLSGLETFSVVVDGHIDGTFKQVQYLDELRRIQGFIAHSSGFDFNVSLADYLALLNSAGNDSGRPEPPQDDAVVQELLLFIKHRDIAQYVSPDFSKASILVRCDDKADFSATLAALRAFVAQEVDPDLEVHLTGEPILADNAARQMVAAQARSLAMMAGVIFVVIGVLFLNLRAGLMAVLPNLFLVLVLFGVMGGLGIPLDTGTAMIAAITLGVCVDHTMHFMVRYNAKARAGGDGHEAIAATLAAEAVPVLAASMALAAGLGTLTLSSFPPVAYFGGLSALLMLLAFCVNFLLTPVLLSFTHLTSLWEILSIRLRQGLLSECPLFRGMRPHQVKRLILMGRLRRFADGEAIMHAGDPSRELHVLLSGRVQTSAGGGRTLSRGAVFGLVALVCGEARLITATASGTAEVLSLDWGRIQRLSRFHPRVAAALFRNLSSIIAERFHETVRLELAQGPTPAEDTHRGAVGPSPVPR